MRDAAPQLQDRRDRRIRYVRVSLTDRCNFRCGFCVPERRAIEDGGEAAGLAPGERRRLCRVFFGLGVGNFKITGGEPFMAPDAIPLMAYLKGELGAESVTVTTNGATLDRHAPELVAAGVDGINVSLNAMSQEVYREVTGSDFPLARVRDNVLLAKGLGLNVKLNMVPIRNLNAGEILPFLDFALAHGLHARFIELMPIGQGREHEGVSFQEIREIVEARYGRVEVSTGRLGNGPAVYFTVQGYDAKLGFIAAVSERFCASCNRIRLTARGFLKTCLHHRHGVDLAGPLRAGETDGQLAQRIREAVADKPDSHRFGESRDGAGQGDEPMYRIGG